MKSSFCQVLAACVCSCGLAADPVEVKSGKTSREEAREMSTDRPDQTEGAYTVPKGWFQVEMGLATWTRRLDTDHADVAHAWGEFNFKYGLTNNTDLQLVWVAYNRGLQDGGPEEENAIQAGAGDLVTRFKWNVLGNDGGPIAVSLLPYVKIPVASQRIGNNMWEGGLFVNAEMDVGGGFALGSSLFGSLAVDEDDGHYFRPGGTLVLGRDVTERLAWYWEVFTAWQYDSERYWLTSLDTGFTYALTQNLLLDLSVFWYFRGEEAIQGLVGLSWRF